MKKLKLFIFKLIRKKKLVTRSKKHEVGKIRLGVEFVSGEMVEYLIVGEDRYNTAEDKAGRFFDIFRYDYVTTIDNITFNPEIFKIKKTVLLAHVSHKITTKHTERISY